MESGHDEASAREGFSKIPGSAGRRRRIKLDFSDQPAGAGRPPFLGFGFFSALAFLLASRRSNR